MPDDSSRTALFTCNLCEALCGMQVTLDGGAVTAIRPDPDDVFSRGHICPKGPALRELFHDPDRLRQPMKRTADGFRPVSWDEALDATATRLRDIQKRHGRDAVALYIGNPTVHGHRAGLGSQALAAALSTRNRYDANSQDSNPRLFACMQVYGDALSMPVPDVERTDHFLVLGANPAVSNGSQMALGDVRGRMQAIRARGGKVVLLDPRRSETAAWATEHHFLRPGSDAALLLGMLHTLFEEDRVDSSAVGEVASGLRALRTIAGRFSPERVAKVVGIEASTIRRLARELAFAPRAAVYARVGTCQNEFGPLACWLVEALNLVTGNFDREGGVMFPTPAADIAPLGRMLVGNHVGRWRSRVRGLPEFLGALPSSVLAEEMETEGEGKIRALVTYAGNPVLSTPNGDRLARAIAGLDFSVSIDFYVNETNRMADYILPPAHVFQSGNFDILILRFTVRNLLKYSPPILPKAEGERDDWEIASDLGLRIALGDAPRTRRMLAPLLRRLPEQLVDTLLRIGPARTTLENVAAAPHGLDLGPLVPSRHRTVRTPDRRARLAPEAMVADLPRLDAWIDRGPGEGLVLVGRRHLRSNNSWLHNTRSLVKGPDRARLLMNPDDATARGLENGARVRVASRTGELLVPLTVSAEMMPGVVSLPHGYGHASLAGHTNVAAATPGPSVNTLTDERRVEPLVGTSILNGIEVTVERGLIKGETRIRTPTPTPTPIPTATPTPTPIPSRTRKPTPSPTQRATAVQTPMSLCRVSASPSKPPCTPVTSRPL